MGRHFQDITNKKNKTLSVRRKSRKRSGQRAFQRTLNNKKKTTVFLDHNYSCISERSNSQTITDVHEIEQGNLNVESQHELNSCPPTCSSNDPTTSYELSGRRIFDVAYLFQQLSKLGRHEPFGCGFQDMIVLSEQRRGLKSKFFLKCKLCGLEDALKNENENQPEKCEVDINNSIVLGTLSTGIGHAELNEITAAINMPFMTYDTYAKCASEMADVICNSAWQTMEEAGKEEAKLAIERGEIDQDGIPCITVVTGAWSKRSYNVNYNASSGVGCIIGLRTGKLLFLGVKNKYCSVCARLRTRQCDPPQHICWQNWSGSSTSMESNIIAEGFNCSLDMHGLKYSRMVGDGDSSVYKKLCELKPYGNQLVEKVECRNHLLRNFVSKLRDITKRRHSHSKNQIVPPVLRKLLEKKISAIRACVTKAIRHRIMEEEEFEKKRELLYKDLNNVPSHVFGEHMECASISYFECTGNCLDENMVTDMRETGIYQDIMVSICRLTDNLSSLLLDMDNNTAELYNSVVCKFVGGKRKNYSLRRGYQTRCEAAALSYNTRGEYYQVLYSNLTSKSWDNFKFAKHFVNNKVRALQQRQMRIRKKRNIVLASADEDYGLVQEFVPDMPSEEYEMEKQRFIDSMKKTNTEIEELERQTRNQGDNKLWKEERHIRLTASNFGIICRMRPGTSCSNTVQKLLYSSFTGNRSTRWGTEHEEIALEEFQLTSGYRVEKCGLFVNKEWFYLGASPDGVIDTNSIVEVKCPASAAQYHPKEAIRRGIIKFAELVNEELRLKKSHHYFYQVQGQLAISNKDLCYFVVWTPKGLLVEPIRREVSFWNAEMLPALNIFYFNCLLPELLDPRERRGLKIRNPPRNAILEYDDICKY